MAARAPLSAPDAPSAISESPSKTAAPALRLVPSEARPEPLRLRLVAGPGYWSARAVMKREAWMAERGKPDAVDESVVVGELRRRCAGWGSRKRVAFELGVCAGNLRLFLEGRRRIPARVAEQLGFRVVGEVRHRIFERVE